MSIEHMVAMASEINTNQLGISLVILFLSIGWLCMVGAENIVIYREKLCEREGVVIERFDMVASSEFGKHAC